MIALETLAAETIIADSADALIALTAFERRFPDFVSDLKPEPAVNLAVAAALASGLEIDPDEISEPAFVVKAAKQ